MYYITFVADGLFLVEKWKLQGCKQRARAGVLTVAWPVFSCCGFLLLARETGLELPLRRGPSFPLPPLHSTSYVALTKHSSPFPSSEKLAYTHDECSRRALPWSYLIITYPSSLPLIQRRRFSRGPHCHHSLRDRVVVLLQSSYQSGIRSL